MYWDRRFLLMLGTESRAGSIRWLDDSPLDGVLTASISALSAPGTIWSAIFANGVLTQWKVDRCDMLAVMGERFIYTFRPEPSRPHVYEYILARFRWPNSRGIHWGTGAYPLPADQGIARRTTPSRAITQHSLV